MARIQVSTADSLEHIFREIDTPNKVFYKENLYFLPHTNSNLGYKGAIDFRDQHIAEMEKKYKELTGQKVQAKTNRSYSAVFECNENTTAADIYEMLGKKIEAELDTKIFAIAIHRDEGCLIDKNGIRLTSGDDFLLDKKGQYWLRAEGDKKGFFKIKLTDKIVKERGFTIENNYHAHIEFCGLRNNGRSIQDKQDPRIKSGKIQQYTPQHYAKELCDYHSKIFPTDEKNKILGLFERLKSVDNPQINELFSEMEQPKIKRINGAKHLLSNLNSLANGEKLHKRDLAATKSMLKQCGVDNFLLLEAERKRAKERECELETANQRLNAELSDLSNKSQKTTQDMANELKTLQNASNELKTAQMKIDELEAKLNKTNSNYTAVLDENKSLKKKLKAHEDATNIAEPGQALLTKTEIIGAIKANFSRCSNDSETKALTDYYRHIKNTPAEDARMREDEFVKQINRIIPSEQSLQEYNQELREALKNTRTERDTAQKRVDELEADRDQAQKRVDELEAELDETRSLYNATASVNEWLQGQKQKLQAELDELQEVQDYELDELQEAQYYELDELQEVQDYELDEPQEVQDYELDEPQQKPTIRHRR